MRLEYLPLGHLVEKVGNVEGKIVAPSKHKDCDWCDRRHDRLIRYEKPGRRIIGQECFKCYRENKESEK